MDLKGRTDVTDEADAIGDFGLKWDFAGPRKISLGRRS